MRPLTTKTFFTRRIAMSAKAVKIAAVLFPVMMAVIMTVSLKGCVSGNSQIAELQKQNKILQEQLEAKNAAPAPLAPAAPAPKSEVEQAIEGVVKTGGEMYFGKNTVKEHLANEADKKRLEAETNFLVVQRKLQAEAKEKATAAREELEQIEECITDRKNALSVCKRVAREARLSNLAIDASVERQANRDSEANEREIDRLQRLKAKVSSR